MPLRLHHVMWKIITEVTDEFANQKIEELLNEYFEDIDIDNLVLNKVQRMLLVGFSVDESLQQMIE